MVLKRWFIIIFAPPGNGKSLEQARLSYRLIKEYYHIEKKYPNLPPRFLYTNQLLASHIEFRFPKLGRKDPHIFERAYSEGKLRYWEHPEQLRYCPVKDCWKDKGTHPLHDCDLFCDEGATLFPATAKGAHDDMPLWLKKLITQHRHNGIRIVLLTQDFMGINITTRRCVWEAWLMEKAIGSRDPTPSLPPIKFIWGWYTKRRIAPELIHKDATDIRITLKLEKERTDELQKVKLVGFPKFDWISRFKCSLYDTTQNVKEYIVKREVEHIEAPCTHAGCYYVHRTHKLK